MATYEIVPETTITGNVFSSTENSSVRKCRERCDDHRECGAFLWEEKNGGTCSLLHNVEGLTQYDSTSMLYIKGPNKSYWLLWVFLGMLGILVFAGRCKSKY